MVPSHCNQKRDLALLYVTYVGEILNALRFVDCLKPYQSSYDTAEQWKE